MGSLNGFDARASEVVKSQMQDKCKICDRALSPGRARSSCKGFRPRHPVTRRHSWRSVYSLVSFSFLFFTHCTLLPLYSERLLSALGYHPYLRVIVESGNLHTCNGPPVMRTKVNEITSITPPSNLWPGGLMTEWLSLVRLNFATRNVWLHDET